MDKINLINLFVEDHNVVYNWDEKDILTLDKLIKDESRGERGGLAPWDPKPGVEVYYYSKDPFSHSKNDNLWLPKNIKKKDLPSWNSRNIFFFESFLNIDFVEKDDVPFIVVSKIHEPQPKIISGTKLFEGAQIEAFYLKERSNIEWGASGAPLCDFRNTYKGIKFGTIIEFRFVDYNKNYKTDMYCAIETLSFDGKCQMMKNKFYLELGKDLKKAELALKKWKRELFII